MSFVNNDMLDVGKNARISGIKLSSISINERNSILREIINELNIFKDEILYNNSKDIKYSVENGLSESLIMRLKFDENKFNSCIKSIESVIEFDDPIGKITLSNEITSDGLKLYRKTCSIGVILIIFESRPEVAIQIASLTIKSGNSVILKGGKEAINTNTTIMKCLNNAIKKSSKKYDNVEQNIVQMVYSHNDINELLLLNDYIDLVIPRGSRELVNSIKKRTSIPVLGHSDGVCMLYLHYDSNIDNALDIIIDSKTNYPSACNSLETLLIHRNLVELFLPLLSNKVNELGIKLIYHADEYCINYLINNNNVFKLDESLYHHEFGSLEICIKSVDSIDEAIDHINKYSSHHTDVILTEDEGIASKFVSEVDSACVFHNCSSRFSDGYRFGFGTEIGISTSRIHARGPVGLEGLLTYKYILKGNGQTIKKHNDGVFEFTRKPI
ncbi:hypothetical protein FG379_000268 [Cryptosporidium bovis]|uniref:uncharacterized protein n=1 Tax=Cryptosporidium bovis TaxID=310047 RepID=UPI00351A53B0|nr:hypothetical protein FG379_000268 [Cryptosporidium bovis]